MNQIIKNLTDNNISVFAVILTKESQQKITDINVVVDQMRSTAHFQKSKHAKNMLFTLQYHGLITPEKGKKSLLETHSGNIIITSPMSDEDVHLCNKNLVDKIHPMSREATSCVGEKKLLILPQSFLQKISGVVLT